MQFLDDKDGALHAVSEEAGMRLLSPHTSKVPPPPEKNRQDYAFWR